MKLEPLSLAKKYILKAFKVAPDFENVSFELRSSELQGRESEVPFDRFPIQYSIRADSRSGKGYTRVYHLSPQTVSVETNVQRRIVL